MNPREIDLPEGAGALACWSQVTPEGVFAAMQGGKEVRQLLDAEACERLVEAFTDPVLVDFEHRSEEPDGDTLAAGWAQKLRHSADAGLEAYVEWTDVGAADVRGKRRRYLSGVWRLGPDGRPLKLISMALTNKPRMPNRPVLNKSGDDVNESGEPVVGAPQQQKEGKTMKEIAAIYGLPETATEAEIVAAATADRDKLAALQKELDALREAQLNTEAEKVADENEDRIANKEKFCELYVKNKAAALEFLACLPVAESKPVCNKADARPPSFSGNRTATGNAYETWAAMPEGDAKNAYLDANAAEINDNYPKK